MMKDEPLWHKSFYWLLEKIGAAVSFLGLSKPSEKEMMMSSDRKQINRAPRVRIRLLHRVCFRPRFPRVSGLNMIELANISKTGMGLIRGQIDLNAFAQNIEGELEIRGKSFPITAVVRHKASYVVGCEFTQIPNEAIQEIEEYFRIEILGIRLHPVDQAFLKSDPEGGEVVWFTDGKSNEVYFVYDSSGIRHFHITFLGHYIEGGAGQFAQVGHILEDTTFGLNRQKGSSLINMDNSEGGRDEILQMGKLLIESVEGLPRAQSAQLIAALSTISHKI